MWLKNVSRDIFGSSSLAKMKWVIVFVCLLVHASYGQHFLKVRRGLPPAGAPKTRAVYPDVGWITQRVDNFNPTDLRTWQMRYLNNSQFFQPGGPIFIFLGGEWEISSGYLMTGQMFDMAEEHNGYMFYTEHRYYGVSFPLPDISTRSLLYLNVEQALVDVAHFIEYQKRTIPGLANSKVVVVGGSYSATMATWLRIKYPHLVDAGLASSAPLRAVDDFYEYFEVVGHNLGLSSQECVDTISEAIAEIEAHLEDPQEGVPFISNLFNTCGLLNTEEPDRGYFFTSLANPFAGLVQYAAPGQIDYECGRLLNFEGRSLLKFAAYINDYYEGWCLSDYQVFIEWYNQTELTTDIYRQWVYQTCTEYGFYQTANSPNQPFWNTFGLDVYTVVCRDLFNFGTDILNIGIDRTNLVYGSIYPEVTHLVSVHGTVDPWHAIGVLEDINPLAPVIVVNGTSHCADLSSISPYDPPQLTEAKLRVRNYIAEWIS